MNYYIFVFIALGIVIPITVYSAYNSKHSRIKRQMKKAPRKSIKDVQNGEFIQIYGTIELTGEPLIAPLSGRECGHYIVTVERITKYIKKS